jgi:hypothetical protein
VEDKESMLKVVSWTKRETIGETRVKEAKFEDHKAKD